MTDYTELVKALRCCTSSSPDDCDICAYQPFCQRNGTGRERIMIDAAAAIEALEAAWIKSETDATNLTGRLAQAEADVERLNREIDKRIATEIELSNRCDALEPKRGEWIKHPEVKNIYGGVYIECPFCGEKYVVQNVSDEKFCRNCGADMRAKMEVQDGKRCD